tara:strand:+ start:500 stop:784 length:285 start_codon:yes stop_codon:yes gene_type:complete
MKSNKLYNLSVKTIGELHCERRGFWHNKWIESLTPEQAETIYEKLSAAEESFRQLRNTINHYTLVGEPEELELEGNTNYTMGWHVQPADYDPDY